MKYLETYKLFEKRVPKSSRLEIHRDSNIVVIAPLTHEAHQKYSQHCQWCINSDFYEWDEYHKGGYVLIIQRKPFPNKVGISGITTSEEIYAYQHEIFHSDYYDFGDGEKEKDYFSELTKDIESFDLNTVYYGNGVMYDRSNNSMFEYNREGVGNSKFKVTDIPNVTQEVSNKISEYLKQSEHTNR